MGDLDFFSSRSVSPWIWHNKFYGNIFNIILREKCNRFESALILGCMCWFCIGSMLGDDSW